MPSVTSVKKRLTIQTRKYSDAVPVNSGRTPRLFICARPLSSRKNRAAADLCLLPDVEDGIYRHTAVMGRGGRDGFDLLAAAHPDVELVALDGIAPRVHRIGAPRGFKIKTAGVASREATPAVLDSR